jgi:ABC-2 type transport system ATP-binding protein
MAGGSYGGGIQLVTAAIDPRVDAIAPDIAWHSLVTSLYKDQSPKSGWGTILFALGVEGSLLPGLIGGETGTLDPHITSAFTSAATTGKISDEDVRWFASRGPGALVNRIRAPTLLIQGTVDTLFTLDEAIRNYAILRGNGVPTKMIWFCGGHGACFTNPGPSGFTERATLTWLRRYLKKDLSAKTGPRFQWIADDGRLRSASDYPLPLLSRTTGAGSGVLAFSPDPGTSGTPLAATPGANAVRVPIRKPAAGRQLVGEPRLTITYSGTATTKNVLLYAQIVDLKRGVVVGNVVRPVPIIADGVQHTVRRPLEKIAASVQADSSYELQIVPSTSVYGPQRAAGAITMSQVRITVPIVSGSSADD